jgi:hypothetical protein
MTDAGRLDLDEDFAVARSVKIDFADLERLPAAMATAAFVFIPWASREKERQPCAELANFRALPQPTFAR